MNKEEIVCCLEQLGISDSHTAANFNLFEPRSFTQCVLALLRFIAPEAKLTKPNNLEHEDKMGDDVGVVVDVEAMVIVLRELGQLDEAGIELFVGQPETQQQHQQQQHPHEHQQIDIARRNLLSFLIQRIPQSSTCLVPKCTICGFTKLDPSLMPWISLCCPWSIDGAGTLHITSRITQDSYLST
eukprot:c10922_g1_i2.p1 GENE.c10922_g1_i2~~c10922_g1_i2.p1  ORF type:complete len:185 (-),score=47.99 c10922_g1_i2:182-736(-)